VGVGQASRAALTETAAKAVTAATAATPRRHLARTPPEWAPFAPRNAELAARLTA
jgi:hypothetical protein